MNSTNPSNSTNSKNYLRPIFVLSFFVLAGILVYIGYSVVHRTRLSDIEREQLSRLEDRWMLDFDVVNRDEVEHTYVIKVDTGDPGRQPLTVHVMPGKRFIYTTNIIPSTVQADEVVLEVWRDEEPDPIHVSRYYVR